MPELNVFFFGLICHVDEDEDGLADYAALVKAEDHRPLILFSTTDGYLLESDVSFTDVAPAEMDDTFPEFVPHLRPLINGRLAITEENAWRVEYAKGDRQRARLSVVDTYARTAVHKSKVSGKTKGPERIVARIVRLTVPLTADTVTVRFTGVDGSGSRINDKVIPSGSCVLIANADAASSGAAKKNHFEHYSKLATDSPDIVEAQMRRKAETHFSTVPGACDWVVQLIDKFGKADVHGEHARASTRPECGNTNWP